LETGRCREVEVIIDVSGEHYVDLKLEALGMMKRE
jgi:hypothetical protein